MFSFVKNFFARGHAMANHDFCPGLNKYVRWVKTPVGWVVMSAFCSLLIGLFIGPQGFVMFYSALAILIIGMTWPWLSLKRIQCRIRVADRRVNEGQPLRVVLEVENRWPIPVFGLFVRGDFLQDESLKEFEDVEMDLVALSRVPAWSKTEFTWEVIPDRRGEFPASQPEIVTGFPFGLYRSRKPIQIADKAIAWPTVEFSFDISPENGVLRGISGTCSELSGNDGETISVREYRPGDQIKSIHWSRTARLNQLFVRDRQAPAFAQVRVVVDLAHRSHSHSVQSETYENSIRAAAKICRILHQKRIPVELICIGLPERNESQLRDKHGLELALDELALLPRLSSPTNQSTQTTEQASSPFSHANPNNILIGSSISMSRFGNVAGIQRILVGESGSIEMLDHKAVEILDNSEHQFSVLDSEDSAVPIRAMAV